MATTPSLAAEKWVRNLSASTAEVRRGVEGVSESPMDKAADQADKYALRVQEAVASGKYARKLREVSLADWKTATIDKGLNRIASGATAAESKFERFMDELLPYEEALQRSIDAMPDTTLEDSIARQAAWTRGMAEFPSRTGR